MKKFAVIASLDLETSDSVINVCSKIASIIDGIKIGVPTLLESGKEILPRVCEILGDKPLLVDLKIADIGFKSSVVLEWDQRQNSCRIEPVRRHPCHGSRFSWAFISR